MYTKLNSLFVLAKRPSLLHQIIVFCGALSSVVVVLQRYVLVYGYTKFNFCLLTLVCCLIYTVYTLYTNVQSCNWVEDHLSYSVDNNYGNVS